MSTSRDRVLARIRAALADVPPDSPAPFAAGPNSEPPPPPDGAGASPQPGPASQPAPPPPLSDASAQPEVAARPVPLPPPSEAGAEPQASGAAQPAHPPPPSQAGAEPGVAAWPRAPGEAVDDAVVGLFAERCADYGAQVVRLPAAETPAAAAGLVAGRGVSRAAVPSALDPALMEALAQAGVELVGDSPPLPAAELDRVDGVVTACRVGVAQTGTLVLDHAPDQGRRALTLVPDLHLCLIRADQIVPDVPQAVARLRPSVLAGRPLTWVSGPSATVDIELTRVEGVHGPRTLLVVITE